VGVGSTVAVIVGVSSAISCSDIPVLGSVSRPAGILVALGIEDGEGIAVDVFTVNVAVDVYVSGRAVAVFDGVIVHVGVTVLVGICVDSKGVAVAVIVGAGVPPHTGRLNSQHANNNTPAAINVNVRYVCGSNTMRRTLICTASQSIVGSLFRFMPCP
jgi:hypothetical protein